MNNNINYKNKFNTVMDMMNERVETYGADTLHDEEILSIITGIDIFKIKEYICKYGSVELIKYIDTFKITKVQRNKLKLIYKFIHRITTAEYKNKPKLDSSEKAGEYFVYDLKFYKNEVFKVAILDSQNRLISSHIISEGIVNEAPIYPREILKLALNNNAISVILAHNHPGGTMNPSQSDINSTKKLVEALGTVSIKVIDHIIVADNKYVSMAERGLI